jgi:hypothetical protein
MYTKYCTLEISVLHTELTKTVRNEIIHVQCTTDSAVIPFYKLTGRFKSEHTRYYEKIIQVN